LEAAEIAAHNRPQRPAVLSKLYKAVLNNCGLVSLLVICQAFFITSKVYGDMAHTDAKPLERPVQFAFISNIGGMVGGLSAISNSTYISRSGLVQVSKEDTNGVLHTLMVAQTDTSEVFKDISRAGDFTKIGKANTDKKDNVLSEYYPPTKFVSYFYEGDSGSVHEYFGYDEHTGFAKKISDNISDFVAKTKLHSANLGIYVRAQRLPNKNLHFIKFDLVLEPDDLISFPILTSILENEMAMVGIPEKNGDARLDNNIVIRPGYNLHIRVGQKAYVVFTYQLLRTN
jgi:hypothetical protein